MNVGSIDKSVESRNEIDHFQSRKKVISIRVHIGRLCRPRRPEPTFFGKLCRFPKDPSRNPVGLLPVAPFYLQSIYLVFATFEASELASAVVGSGKPVSSSSSWITYPLLILFSFVVLALAAATFVARYLSRQANPSFNPAQLQRFVLRLRAWWMMVLFIVFGLVINRLGIIVIFALISFWAFREFITMTPTRRGDHRALFWSLVVFTPLQYILIGLGQTNWEWKPGRTVDFYGLYSIMIPVYASLFIPARIAMAGDHKRFLERSAQITLGLLICVYSLSHAPAILDLSLAQSNGTLWTGSNAGLLFFFVLISQLSDVLQWSWGQIAGRHIVAPEISNSRTWEGCIGGSLSAGLCGAVLYWVTPFQIYEAAIISIVVAFLGFAGGMTMSAIKRNRGVQDYGTLVMGHAGVLDRIDMLCFSAPIFYHITRFFFSV